jgi:protein-disulfide isomerase
MEVVMTRSFALLLAVCAVLLRTAPAAAQTKTCDALRGPARDIAQAVLSSQHPYDCCDETLAKCLKKKPVCKLVTRLADDVCRRAGAGSTRAEIERELERRAASALGTQYAIDLKGAVPAGDPTAKVSLVVYACARCPYCARLVPALYESVTNGHLKGKARLYLKPFPIRTHQHSTVGAMAWMAADKLGHLWDMVLYMYSKFDQFDPAKLPDYAAEKGLDRERFRALLEDSGLRARLAESKKEGIRNKVEATPAFYIEGRRYQSQLDQATVEDFVEERFEQTPAR